MTLWRRGVLDRNVPRGWLLTEADASSRASGWAPADGRSEHESAAEQHAALLLGRAQGKGQKERREFPAGDQMMGIFKLLHFLNLFCYNCEKLWLLFLSSAPSQVIGWVQGATRPDVRARLPRLTRCLVGEGWGAGGAVSSVAPSVARSLGLVVCTWAGVWAGRAASPRSPHGGRWVRWPLFLACAAPQGSALCHLTSLVPSRRRFHQPPSGQDLRAGEAERGLHAPEADDGEAGGRGARRLQALLSVQRSCRASWEGWAHGPSPASPSRKLSTVTWAPTGGTSWSTSRSGPSRPPPSGRCTWPG